MIRASRVCGRITEPDHVSPNTVCIYAARPAGHIEGKDSRRMGSSALTEAAKSIRDWSISEGHVPAKPANAAEIFGTRVFSDKVQQERLPKTAYRALRATITRGETLDLATADAVALALKD